MFTPPQGEDQPKASTSRAACRSCSRRSGRRRAAVSNDDMEKSRAAIIESRVSRRLFWAPRRLWCRCRAPTRSPCRSPASPTPRTRSTPSARPASSNSRASTRSPMRTKTKIENSEYAGEGVSVRRFGRAHAAVGRDAAPHGGRFGVYAHRHRRGTSRRWTSATLRDFHRLRREHHARREGAKAFARRHEGAAHEGQDRHHPGQRGASPPLAVQSEIPDGNVQITGGYSLDEAKAMQTVLESGSLPVSFEYAQSQTVPDARPGRARIRCAGGAHRPCSGHAVPAVLLPRPQYHHPRRP